MMVILSLGLSGVQLLPTLELVGQGMRAELTFETFNQYNLPLYQIPILLFPFLYGGAPESFYGLGYFGEWNFLEMNGYLGYLPLFLAACGICVCKNRPLVWVWVVVAVLAFLLAMPIKSLLKVDRWHYVTGSEHQNNGVITILRAIWLIALFGLSIIATGASSYSPFIYFRF